MGLSRPVMGLLYLHFYRCILLNNINFGPGVQVCDSEKQKSSCLARLAWRSALRLVRMVAVANKDASQDKRRPLGCTLDDLARLFGPSPRSCRQCGYALTVPRTEPVLVLIRRTQTGRARLGSSSEILRAVLLLYNLTFFGPCIIV